MDDNYPGKLRPKESDFIISGGIDGLVHCHDVQGMNEHTDFVLHPTLNYSVTVSRQRGVELLVTPRSFLSHIGINQDQTRVVHLTIRLPVIDKLVFEVIDNNNENPTDFLIHVDDQKIRKGNKQTLSKSIQRVN